jgi:hypothetical protein
MDVTRIPILAETGDWANPNGALLNDGDFATFVAMNEYLATLPLGPKLVLSGFSGTQIPEGNEIVGIQIRFRAKLMISIGTGGGGGGGGGRTDALYVGPTKNRSSVSGTPSEVLLGTSWEDYTIGSPTHLWDSSWSLADINSQDFGVIFEFSFPGIASNVEYYVSLDWAEIDVFYAYSGETFTMGTSLTSLQQVQVGFETTPGTPVACPYRLKKTKIEIQPDAEFKQYEHAGEKITGQSHFVKEDSNLPVSGDLTFDESVIVLESHFGKARVQALGSGAYQWTFVKRVMSEDDPRILTVQNGDADRNRQSSYVRVNSLELGFSHDSVDFSGSAIGRAMSFPTNRTAGTNEVQTITASGTGVIQLSFQGVPAANLTLPLTNSAIQTALNAISTIGASGVAVTGSGPFVVTFSGTALAGENHPMIEVKVISGSPTVTIAETTRGGLTEFECIPVLPGTWSLFTATDWSSITSGRLGQLSEASINFGEVAKARHTADLTNGRTLEKIVDQRHTIEMSFTVESDAASRAIAESMRLDADRFFRAESVGPVIGGGINHLFRIDMATNSTGVGNFSDDDEVYAQEFTFEAVRNASWGNAMIVTVINKVAPFV